MTITADYFPLAQCRVAPENPRFDRAPEDVEPLADTIEAHGVLQPLIGYLEAGIVNITAGARRFAAFGLLTQRDTDAAHKALNGGVPIHIREKDAAIAAGIVEQTMRVNLHPAEEAAAFGAMVKKNQDTATIAKAFGRSERFVQQRLKLSTLFAPIFEAFKNREITVDVAQAFAAGNEERQQAAWEKLGPRATVARIKSQFEDGAMAASDRLALFVGEEAYKAAGGAVDADLFSEGPAGYWLDPAKAELLALEKLREAGEALKAEGWSFVHVRIDPDHSIYSYDRETPQKGKPNEEQKARIAAITARLSEIHRDDDGEVDFYDLTDEQQLEVETLEAEQEAIEKSLHKFGPNQKKRSGVEISIATGGVLSYRYGIHLKAAAAKVERAAQKAEAKRKGEPAPETARAPEPEPGSTNTLHAATTRTATEIVRTAVALSPRAALVAITAHLARLHFGWNGNAWGWQFANPVDLSIAHPAQGVSAFNLTSAAKSDAADKLWREMLEPYAKDLETYLGEHDPKAGFVESLFAYVAAPVISCVEIHAEQGHDAKRRARFAAIAKIAGADPALYVPRAEDLKGYNKAALQGFAKDMKLDLPANAKTAVMAEMVADRAKAIRWQPPLIRELLGAPKFKLTTPAPKPTKAAKAGKTAKAKTPAKQKAAKPKAEPKPKRTTSASGRVLKINKAGTPSMLARKRGRTSKADIAARESAALAERDGPHDQANIAAE